MIRFKDVSLLATREMVLRHLSFTIEPGECVCIAGPSGSGKSLLLTLLMGNQKPTFGIVSVDGINLAQLTPPLLQHYRRSIGVMLQEDQLFHDRSVASNIALPLEMKKVHIEEMAVRTAALLEAIDLYEKAAALPETLHYGERRRTALAQALAGKPTILLLDEPFADLDHKSKRITMTLIRNAHAAGTTVIMTTHQSEDCKEMKARTMCIENGTILEENSVAKQKTSVRLERT
jgi:cell division transport system ATP-binding protein